MDNPIIFVVVVIAVLAGVIGIAIHYDNLDQAEWVKFSTDHKCKLVSRMSGTVGTGTGIMSNGKVGFITTYQSGKDGFTCDDGVTYYRSN